MKHPSSGMRETCVVRDTCCTLSRHRDWHPRNTSTDSQPTKIHRHQPPTWCKPQGDTPRVAAFARHILDPLYTCILRLVARRPTLSPEVLLLGARLQSVASSRRSGGSGVLECALSPKMIFFLPKRSLISKSKIGLLLACALHTK